MRTAGDGEHDERMRRFGRPENEVPGALAVSALLARSEHSALTLTGVEVFSTGLAFTLGLRCRPEAAADGDVGQLLWGAHGGRGNGVLVGVEFADGRRASNAPGRSMFPNLVDDEALLLDQGGGHGGRLSADGRWWLSPLPPEGPLRIVVRCDPLGLPETVTELDGAAIRAAAADVITLWPWVSPAATEPPEPASPQVPPDSWFAAT